MQYLPAFRALHAFEATVRLGSMSAAARELNVTPGAVSRQIAALEEQVGTGLLERNRQGIEVNLRGRKLHEGISKAFEMLNSAMDEARSRHDTRAVTINLFPTFAIQWLMPRLELLHDHAPQTNLRIQTCLRGTDFARDDIDIGIEIVEGPRPGLHMRLLFGRAFTPICAQHLLEQYGGDPMVALMRSHILYSDLHREKWETWGHMLGIGFDESRMIRFENSTLAYQAAREGAGFAIGQPVLLQNDLSVRRLVTPFPQRLQGRRCYYAACREDRKDEPLIRTVMEWLVEQSAESRLALAA
ncbi:LysR substrate-binding domain-containing protein [Alkalilacustris brevis]|uniref:LysR substrate-binding domain-containing protein n=1 Tax=Alkalilacustris brevis TaxID=2026338 RepID=UPI000E0DA34D|nr:LysR substrate-binding domain-containing protein [Alkalilacustris brevis]